MKYTWCSFYQGNCRLKTALNELNGSLLSAELKVELFSLKHTGFLNLAGWLFFLSGHTEERGH